MAKRKKNIVLHAVRIPSGMGVPAGEALKPVISGEAVNGMNYEKSMEALKNMLNKMADKGDIPPMIFGRLNGQFVATPLQEKNGTYILPTFKGMSPIKKFWKARKVDRIMKAIDPILRRDISDVARNALMRKDDADIEKLLVKLKNKERPQLRNRVGCVFLEFKDDFSLQL